MIHLILGSADFNGRIPDAGQCIFWQDDLSVGPVPLTQTLDELTKLRQDFWSSRRSLTAAWNTDKEFLRNSGLTHPSAFSLLQRDQQLHHAMKGSDEVVIWCGPNQREILMLCAVVHFFNSFTLGPPVTLVQCPNWGPLSYDAEELARFFATRSNIPPDLTRVCLELWDRFTNSNPVILNEFMERLAPKSLPLQRVVHWVLQEYPSFQNGLSRIQEKLLHNTGEENSIIRIVGKTIGESDDCVSDIQLYELIREFLYARVPLLQIAQKTRIGIAQMSLTEWHDLRIRLTPFARELLMSKSDYIAVNGIDRWIGGVHLEGQTVRWRFDSVSGRLKGINSRDGHPSG
jgi:hypothetical protein